LKAALSPDASSRSDTTPVAISDESIPPTGDSESPPDAWSEPTTGVRRIESIAETVPARPRRAAAQQPPRHRLRGVLFVAITGALALALGTAGLAYDGRTRRTPAPTPSAPQVQPVAPSPLPKPPVAEPPQRVEAPETPASPAVAEPSPVAPPPKTEPRRAKPRASEAPPTQEAAATPAPAAAAERFETGSVFVNVTGGTGDVYEGGRLLGRAPVRAQLSAGAHRLTVRSADGSTQDLPVDIAAGALSLLTVKLGPANAN